MTTITFEVPEGLLQGLAETPDELGRKIRLAAALHLYSRGQVSQGKGAEIAGLNRRDFITFSAMVTAMLGLSSCVSLSQNPRKPRPIAAGAKIRIVVIEAVHLCRSEKINDTGKVACDFYQALRKVLDGVIAAGRIGISGDEKQTAVRRDGRAAARHPNR